MPNNDNFPRDPFARTVQDYIPQRQVESNSVYFFDTWPLLGAIASVSNRITPWGSNVALRDKQLREFYPQESWLAGAIYTVAIRNAALDWEIQAESTKLETALTDMLNRALSGTQFGWLPFIQKFTTDWHTTDNGAFIELIRDPGIDIASKFKAENAPVIGIGNLDSVRCFRTGNPVTPVVYVDRKSVKHKLKWYEVIPVSELPSPIETMYGVGISALTRIMTLGQIVHSMEMFTDEKISGRHYKQIHFVSGVSKTEIEDVKKRGQEEADNRGEIRFIEPAILASLDPEKPISTATIDLASLPDNFNYDEFMRWYIANIALNMGIDYQDLAPLPSGQLSGGTQAEILHRKSSKKGGKFFMKTIVDLLKNYGVIPQSATFQFTSLDMAEELEKAEVIKSKAETGAILQRSNIMNGPAIREWMKRDDVMDRDILEMVPEEFGAEEFRGGQGNPEMPIGGVGSTTAAEDVRRNKEAGLIRRIIYGLIGDYLKEQRDAES